MTLRRVVAVVGTERSTMSLRTTSRGASRARTVALVAPTVAAVLLAAVPAQAAKAPRARIAYAAGGIHTVDLNGHHRKRLTPKGVAAARPTWSPSGNQIAYLTKPQGEGYANLRLMRANGTHKRTLLQSGIDRVLYDVAWAPGARRVAVALENRAEGVGDVAVYTLKTHKLVRLHVLSGTEWRPLYVDWSPDGKRLIFAAYLTNGNPHEIVNFDLWTIRPNGTGVHQLTNTPEFEQAPVWGPAGNRIAYSVGFGCRAVFIANADGTQPHQVPGGCTGDPDWAPGGGRLVVTSGSKITLTRPDGSQRKNLGSGRQGAWRPR
jgi:Tol biopolymer transport system component